MTVKTTLVLAFTLALGVLATSARADSTSLNPPSVPLQEYNPAATTSNNTGVGGGLGGTAAGPTIGETFTSTFSGDIDYATFSLYGTYLASYKVKIFSVDPQGNTSLLNTSSAQDLPVGAATANLASVTFYFPTAVKIVSGEEYLLQLVEASSIGLKLGALITRDPSYTAGTWYSGAPLTANLNIDLLFAVGNAPLPVVSTVPEPANAALLMAGLGFMGLLSRRRKTSK